MVSLPEHEVLHTNKEQLDIWLQVGLREVWTSFHTPDVLIRMTYFSNFLFNDPLYPQKLEKTPQDRQISCTIKACHNEIIWLGEHVNNYYSTVDMRVWHYWYTSMTFIWFCFYWVIWCAYNSIQPDVRLI